MSKEVSLWKNNRPKKFYPKAVKLFGKPNYVANVPHGMAYWKTNKNKFIL